MIDLWLPGVETGPVTGLVDSGALRTRFARDLADLAGADLDLAATEQMVVDGLRTQAAPARIALRIGSGEDAYEWECPVWFCDPWPLDFQLPGVEGFLQLFRVTLPAYHEWVDCVPEL